MTRFHLTVAALLLTAAAATPAPTQMLGAPVTNILAGASDRALDKLSQPGAFFADEAVRIALPGPLRKMGGLMKLADQTGLTNGLSKSINDAAGIAAKEAKPIFRSAIGKMDVRGGIGVLSSGDGGTKYLRQSAGDELRTKIRPMIVTALGKTGAFGQLDRMGGGAKLLGGLGIDKDGLTDSVTDQTLDGIYKYIGSEESKLRANPLGNAKKLLGGFKP